MDIKKTSTGIQTFNYRVVLILLILIPLYLFNNIYIKTIGSIFIILILLFSILKPLIGKNKIRVSNIIIWQTIFIMYSILMLMRTPTIKALYSYFLQTGLIFFIGMFTQVRFNSNILEKTFKIGRIIYLILLIPASIIAFEGGRTAFTRFDQYYSGTIYKIMLPCTFFYIAGSKRKLLKVMLFSLIYLRMVERTSAIVLLVIYVVYVILKKIKQSNKLYNFLYIVIFNGIVIFTYIYVKLQYTELGNKLNFLFRKYTGGNFFSGRNYIWETLFEFIKKKPLLGYGFDNNVMELANISMSPHNTYIYILLQSGIIGLFIFFMFMYSIWKSYFKYLYNDIVMVSASYLIGTLIFINFEVSMVANSVVIAIFYWFIIGIGIAVCNSIKYKEIDFIISKIE